ncbi:Kinesin-4 [Hexamita inflata]|uniref:Kinesin-like protein n=1 Tax=Hexamita inflata TaxID=28002 RepID=A0AA86RHY7_9EUKA|nr:Kinesin-4 [Hexamita inflata]
MSQQNITVAIRIRPPLKNELEKTSEIVVKGEQNKVILDNLDSLEFDYVFDQQSSQQYVFDTIGINIIESFISGFSTSLLAFGQTSSGKTHTLGLPDIALCKQQEIPENSGLIPRLINLLFQKTQQISVKSLKVTYLEVYNEQIRDLLSPQQQQVQIKEILSNASCNKMIQITTPQANHLQVQTAEEAISCFVNGGINRATAATKMNSQSSRSHALFTIYLEQIQNGSIVKSKLNLVDLAGSERQSKAGAQGVQFKEMISINQGLLTLGNVIKILSENNGAHVPYRDSKLTRLLQDSIGGLSKCVFVACVSSSAYNSEESMATLKYAARARNIKNCPVKIIQENNDDVIQNLMIENRMLKEQLEQASFQQIMPSPTLSSVHNPPNSELLSAVEQVSMRYALNNEYQPAQLLDQFQSYICNQILSRNLQLSVTEEPQSQSLQLLLKTCAFLIRQTDKSQIQQTMCDQLDVEEQMLFNQSMIQPPSVQQLANKLKTLEEYYQNVENQTPKIRVKSGQVKLREIKYSPKEIVPKEKVVKQNQINSPKVLPAVKRK